MKRFKRDIIYLLFSISLFSCSSLDKQRVDMPINKFLIMESNINSSDIISKIVYLFPSNGIINKVNYKVDGKDYNFTFLYLTRDGFQLLPCCEYGQVSYLSKDIEKSLKTFSEKRLDSLTDINTIISNKLNKDIAKIKTNKDMQLIRNDKIYRIVKVKGLEYCECKYRIPDDINIDEGFLLSVDKLEVINLKIMNEITDQYLKTEEILNTYIKS